MPVADKYRLQRQIGWSDAAEVHSGPPDATHRVPVAVKIRHGMGDQIRPDGNRSRFLRAANDQQAAVQAGCKQIAPIFETGLEGGNAFYVTRLFQRSLDALIQGRVTLNPAALHRVTDSVLQALEELRDRVGRPHGNLKPTNIFLDGGNVRSASVMLGDLALRGDADHQAADCYALGAVLCQLVRGRAIRNFDWPIIPGPDWERLGPQADAWREFCNVLMAPGLSSQPDSLAQARTAFKNMRRLGANAVKEARGRGESGRPPASKKGLFAGVGAGIAALAGLAAVLFQPPDSRFGRQLRSVPALMTVFRLIDLPKLPSAPARSTPPIAAATSTPGPVAGSATAVPDSPASSGDGATAGNSPSPPPEVADAPPTPAPTVNPGDRWIGYTALLQQLQETLADPAALEQPELLNASLSRLKDSVGFLPINGEPSVAAFLRRLPDKLEATGDQPDLPANLWTKEGTTRQDDVQSVTYQWGRSGYRLPFNRVAAPGGNAPAFYLSATVVPVQFGVVLAKMAESDGKGPLSGASSVKGPVSWEAAGGNYALRPTWMVLDSINSAFYTNAGRPSALSPMNGLSPIEAVRLARAAGCALPTLAQWNAVLASSSGQPWVAQWQSVAKVRSPQWSAFAKGIQGQRLTGAKLPNDQCFGDRSDLGAVTQTPDSNLFFEPVNTRALKGFSHLIGNVGQYVVDEARNPTKYYFAGGSAESAPAVFQSLTAPPVVAAPFLAAADGGLRLVALAKGNGSEKNPALDKLKADLDAEVARARKLQ